MLDSIAKSWQNINLLNHLDKNGQHNLWNVLFVHFTAILTNAMDCFFFMLLNFRGSKQIIRPVWQSCRAIDVMCCLVVTAVTVQMTRRSWDWEEVCSFAAASAVQSWWLTRAENSLMKLIRALINFKSGASKEPAKGNNCLRIKIVSSWTNYSNSEND